MPLPSGPLMLLLRATRSIASLAGARPEQVAKTLAAKFSAEQVAEIFKASLMQGVCLVLDFDAVRKALPLEKRVEVAKLLRAVLWLCGFRAGLRYRCEPVPGLLHLVSEVPCAVSSTEHLRVAAASGWQTQSVPESFWFGTMSWVCQTS